MSSFLPRIPSVALKPILALAADVVDLAASLGDRRWGLTYFDDWGIRVNVGWTEVLTVSDDGIRLIDDHRTAASLKARKKFRLQRGTGSKSFYPSIPGSALVKLAYTPNSELKRSIAQLRPALRVAIELAGRRRVGKGVASGHNQWAVDQVARVVGRPLPSPGYTSSRLAVQLEASESLAMMEGALKRVVRSVHERSRAAREQCIRTHGTSCAVCDFSFEQAYGRLGRGFIHVHHLRPMAEMSERYIVHPTRDLRPVCPNCHAMLHREEPPISLDELRSMLR